MSYKTFADEWFVVDEPYDTQAINAVQDNQFAVWDDLRPIPAYYFPIKNPNITETARTAGAYQFRRFSSSNWECIWIRPYIILPGTEKLVLHLYAKAFGNYDTSSVPLPAAVDDGAYIQFTESFDTAKIDTRELDGQPNGPYVLKIDSNTDDYYSIDLPVTKSDVPQITYLQLWYKSTTPRVKFYIPGDYWTVRSAGTTLWKNQTGDGWPIDIIYPEPYISMNQGHAVADSNGVYNLNDIQSNIPQPGGDNPRLLEFCIVKRNPQIHEVQITADPVVIGHVYTVTIEGVPFAFTALTTDKADVADGLSTEINNPVTGSDFCIANTNTQGDGQPADGYIRLISERGYPTIPGTGTYAYYTYTVSVTATDPTKIEDSIVNGTTYYVQRAHKILGYVGGFTDNGATYDPNDPATYVNIENTGTFPAVGWWILPPIQARQVAVLEPLSTGGDDPGFAICELGWFQPYSIGVEEVRSAEPMRDYSAKESVIAPGQPTKTRTPFELLVGDGVNYSRSRVLSFGGNQEFAGDFVSQYAHIPANRPGDTPYGNIIQGSPLVWDGSVFKYFNEPRLCPLAIQKPVPTYYDDKYVFKNEPVEVYLPITGVLGHEAVRVLFLLVSEGDIPRPRSGGTTTQQVDVTNVLVEFELMQYQGSVDIDATAPISLSPAIKVSQTYEVSKPELDPGVHLSYWSQFVEGCFNQDDVQMIMANGRFGSLSLTGFPDFASRPNYAGSEQEEPYILRFSVSVDEIENLAVYSRIKVVGYTIIAESK